MVEAAAQVFHREGATATTNRIADRAGVSIGTLYQYFPNKESLLQVLAERHLRDVDVVLDEVTSRLRREALPFDETMCGLLEAAVSLHDDWPGLHDVLHRLGPRTVRDLEVLRAIEGRLAEDISFHLARCGRGGSSAPLAAQTIVATVDALIHRVMTAQGFDLQMLMASVTALAPPTGQR
ncbi:TetR/AcrR family transcriptional regulator [Streptomyces sp. NPDC056987]|uniref:TetR/AcrR family transcriptional regulator n=1 Tax=Streptomyces sp. NPDC056987 TaxID=3345988 RepID=UPI003632F03D